MRTRVFLSLLAVASALPAQMGPGRAPLYDTKTEQTLEGKVGAVSPGPRGRGLHLTLQSGTESVEVHLGPTTYLDSIGLKVAVGDTLKVTGSRLGTAPKVYVVAREVQAGGRTYTLRDAQGLPAWRRGRRP